MKSWFIFKRAGRLSTSHFIAAPVRAYSDERDLEVTPEEYREIMACAEDDGHLDDEERALLSQFHELLSNGTIQRVRG